MQVLAICVITCALTFFIPFAAACIAEPEKDEAHELHFVANKRFFCDEGFVRTRPKPSQSRRRCGRGGPSPSVVVAGLSPVPAQVWAGVSPVPVQMWQG